MRSVYGWLHLDYFALDSVAYLLCRFHYFIDVDLMKVLLLCFIHLLFIWYVYVLVFFYILVSVYAPRLGSCLICSLLC
jgi:hypothetical protein